MNAEGIKGFADHLRNIGYPDWASLLEASPDRWREFTHRLASGETTFKRDTTPQVCPYTGKPLTCCEHEIRETPDGNQELRISMVSRHALHRYQQHYPQCTGYHVLRSAKKSLPLDPEEVWQELGYTQRRRISYSRNGYTLDRGGRGIFAIDSDANVITYIPLSDQVAQHFAPYLKEGDPNEQASNS